MAGTMPVLCSNHGQSGATVSRGLMERKERFSNQFQQAPGTHVHFSLKEAGDVPFLRLTSVLPLEPLPAVQAQVSVPPNGPRVSWVPDVACSWNSCRWTQLHTPLAPGTPQAPQCVKARSRGWSGRSRHLPPVDKAAPERQVTTPGDGGQRPSCFTWCTPALPLTLQASGTQFPHL